MFSPISNSESTNSFNKFLLWFLFQLPNWEKKNCFGPIRNLFSFSTALTQKNRVTNWWKELYELFKGLCNWCGTGGFCCRKELKLAFIGNGCDGNFGGNNYHACAIPPGKSTFLSNFSSFLMPLPTPSWSVPYKQFY